MAFLDKQTQRDLKEKFLNNKEQDITRPLLLTMAGIPAAGKTTYLNQKAIQAKLPANHYYHNPDNIMESIPQYKRDYNLHGPNVAKSNWEITSRHFAEKILFPLAIKQRCNIVIDMGLARKEIFELLSLSKHNGYALKVIMIYCNLNEALQRSLTRSIYVERNIILKRASYLSTNFNQILALTEDIEYYDNSNISTPFIRLSKLQAIDMFMTYKNI